MDIDGELRKLKEKGFGNPVALSQMAKILATMLDRAAIGWAGKIFWDKKFQQLSLAPLIHFGRSDLFICAILVETLALRNV